MKTSKHPLNSRTVKYKDLLPTQEDPACRGITDTVKCFLAGEYIYYIKWHCSLFTIDQLNSF